jgi:hypothetical protein
MGQAAAPNEFGAWRTAPDGTAHYVLGERCLCGAKVKRWGGPPVRKHFPSPHAGGKHLTEYCRSCLDQNYLRWAKKGGLPTHVLASRLHRSQRRKGLNPRGKKRE